MKLFVVVFWFFMAVSAASAQKSLQLALLKYNGGGDWYANPTSLPNLARFCSKELGIGFNDECATVEAGSAEIFNYPFVHLTGHGNIVFSALETLNLREYLLSGGFLHVDDNYGLDVFIRREIKKIFPESELVELPDNHPIFNQAFALSKGIPKIHEHDKKPAQLFAVYQQGRIVILYSYEADLGDGWENPEVHNDSESVRLDALRMGANMLQFIFNGQP